MDRVGVRVRIRITRAKRSVPFTQARHKAGEDGGCTQKDEYQA